MDIPIKLKAYEKAAIDYLNRNAPEVYQEKNPGFRWASHTAARKSGIDWERISRIRIEDEFSSEGFSDDDSSISHLTIDDQDFEKLKAEMNQQLGMSRGVQKAFLARAVIKWGMTELERQSRLTSYSKLINTKEQDFSNTDALKLCVDLFCDSLEVNKEKRNVQEEVKKILLAYQRELTERG